MFRRYRCVKIRRQEEIIVWKERLQQYNISENVSFMDVFSFVTSSLFCLRCNSNQSTEWHSLAQFLNRNWAVYSTAPQECYHAWKMQHILLFTSLLELLYHIPVSESIDLFVQLIRSLFVCISEHPDFEDSISISCYLTSNIMRWYQSVSCYFILID